jgi:hypothetical protein
VENVTRPAHYRICSRELRTNARSGPRRAALLLIAMLAWAACQPTRVWGADDPQIIEDRVKAAYLYRFAEFVEWPESVFARRDTPLTIGVLGSDSFASELMLAVTGRKINDRAVTVRRLKPGEPVTGVQILFIEKDESASLKQLAQVAQSQSILTVTESDEALSHGSVINFIVVDQRIRFEISLESAERSKLRLSSRLLAVAQGVRAGRP